MTERYDKIRTELDNMEPLVNVSPFEIMNMEVPLRPVLNRTFRAGKATLTELAAGLELEIDEADIIATLMVEKGILKEVEDCEERTFEARYSGKVHGSRDRISF